MYRLFSGMLLAWVLSTLPGLAHAFDLTGTWQGKQVCKISEANGQERQVFRDDVLQITQSGTEVRILMPSLDLLYTGLAFATADDPNKGAVGFRLCGLSDNTSTEGEMGNAKVSAKPLAVNGKFKATSIFADDDEVDTCRWDYKRTSTTDPGLLPCP